MSFSYSDHERLTALERRIQDLEAQVQLLHELVGQKVGLGSSPSAGSGEQWDVVLHGYGDTSKISVIKVLREVTGLGLKEAKDMSEMLPSVVKVGLDFHEAQALKRKLEEVSGQVEVRPG